MKPYSRYERRLNYAYRAGYHAALGKAAVKRYKYRDMRLQYEYGYAAGVQERGGK